ncbi:MAG TPA: hypothetical protein VMS04_08675 [Vicinamibacterales bacterium]|nr:hypothetical protein [Vicinamibacterales bacterium]
MGLQLGATRTSDEGAALAFDRATTYQATFAWRTWEGSKVAISLEVPFLASPAFTVAAAGGTLPKEYAALYLTPGVRLTVHPNGLVCPCCCSRWQTGSTIWLGDHFPGAHGEVQALFVRSPAMINCSIASLLASRAALISAMGPSFSHGKLRPILLLVERPDVSDMTTRHQGSTNGFSSAVGP